MSDVVMPQMGESIFEGTITKWLKKPGDRVERDEPLFEISTDKVDAEIPAPSAGVLKEIKVTEGQTVPVQTVVAVIESGDGAAAPAKSKPEAKAAAATAKAPAAAKPQPSEPKPTPAAPQPDGSGERTKAAPAPAASAAAAQPSVIAEENEEGASESATGQIEEAAGEEGRGARSSPLVRRLARENNIDLSRVQGTGMGGRISKKDILSAIESGGASTAAPAAARPAPATSAAPPSPPPAAGGAAAGRVTLENAVPRDRIYFGRYEVQPMSVMRQKIAEHMVLSKRVSAHVYSIDEADMSRVAAIRAKSKAEFESRFEAKLTFMPFFLRAAVEALRQFPTVNASEDGTNIVLHREINIGVAVALDNGLIVPVVKNAEEKNFLGLQRAVNDLAERARSKKLKPEEVQEATFSITNPGTFGGLMGLPVINQPNVGILGIGSIQKRPVVVNDAIAIRSMVYLTLSYDHRVVDGATAHQFMGKIKESLENWSEEII
ncbi:MAG TPA: dihydrolipoamide acetyltransferase family protein [Candidatus Acidoferrales bacterium]|nr:dihydrolipoamide acetyltransferase family protein [Candidatus Acidoferrales bacterium]